MSNPSVNKRQKERNRQDKQREKLVKRAERTQNKPVRSGEGGEDPDLAGIIAGPQPKLDEDL